MTFLKDAPTDLEENKCLRIFVINDSIINFCDFRVSSPVPRVYNNYYPTLIL